MQRAFRPVVVGLAIVAGVLGAAATARAQSTVLVTDSQAGDYVGEGERRIYTAADATFTVGRDFGNRLVVTVDGPQSSADWSLRFGGAGDLPLVVGSYRSTRSGSNFNLLDITGGSRACESTGRFDVREVLYAGDGSVIRFAADFEQHCNGRAPALFGAIRYNSTITDGVPFGGRYPSYDLTISPAAGGVVSGADIDCGHGTSSCTVSFRAPAFYLVKATPDPGYELLEWTGDCQGGELISVAVQGSTICAPVFGTVTPVAPRNTLVLDSQAGDYVGDAAQFRYGDATSAWSAQTYPFGNLLQFSINGSDGSWNAVAFRAPGPDTPENRLVPGEYTGAKRAAFSDPEAGLDAGGNGRGCNQITGRFIVYESVYNPDGTIARFAADFEQHCEGLVPALYGSVRYHSTAGGVVPFGGAYSTFRLTSAASPYGRITGGGITVGGITGGGMDCGEPFPVCTATRNSPGPLTLTATPAAGFAFAGWIGDCAGTSPTTVVNVDARDQQCSASYTRTVADTAAPVLTYPPGFRHAFTTYAGGATVTWMPPTAVDAVDGSLAVTCAPASGTMFPVGDTTVTCSAMDGSGNQATTSFLVIVARRALGADLDGDGQTDLLWRGRDGEVAAWLMNGAARTSSSFLGTIPLNWRIAAVGDFTGDGNADIVWQEDTGMVALWEMQGTTRVRTHILYDGYTPWRVAAAADLNSDGHVDLIWQGPGGSVAAWIMRRLATDAVVFLFDADTPWRVVGAGDLDGDGYADVIWQSPSGSVAAWMMNGLSRRDVVTIAGDTDARVEGLVNLNGDSSVDLVWQDPSGAVFAWLMRGRDRLAVVPLYAGSTDWRIAGPR